MIVLKSFKDLIFVDDKLPMITAKIMSLENLYVYGMYPELIGIHGILSYSSVIHKAEDEC